MMDDREIGLIAAFRLHEVASRLGVLARVARSTRLREALAAVSAQLADQERSMSDLATALPADDDLPANSRADHQA